MLSVAKLSTKKTFSINLLLFKEIRYLEKIIVFSNYNSLKVFKDDSDLAKSKIQLSICHLYFAPSKLEQDCLPKSFL